MMIIAVSSSDKSEKEIAIVRELFKNGLEVFHLRKFNCSGRDIEQYIKQIPQIYWNRIVLHSHHRFFLKYHLKGIHISERHKRKRFTTWLKLLYYRYKCPEITVSRSFRNILRVNTNSNNYNYVFLNSTVDFLPLKKSSVVLEGHNVSNIIKKAKYPVVAMGGVRYDNIERIYELGFSGIGLRKTLWNSQDPVDSFLKIKQRCSEIEVKIKAELIQNEF